MPISWKMVRKIANKILEFLPYLGVALVVFMAIETQHSIRRTDETLAQSVKNQEDLRKLIWSNLLVQRSTSLAVTGFLNKDSSYFDRAQLVWESLDIPAAENSTVLQKTRVDISLFEKKLATAESATKSTKNIKATSAELLTLSEGIGTDLVQVESSRWYKLQEHNTSLLKDTKRSHVKLMALYVALLPLMFFLAWILGRKNSAENALRLSETSLRIKTLSLERAQNLARLGTWTWTPLSRASNWSNEVYDILDIREIDTPLTYDRFLTFVHDDDRNGLVRKIERCLEFKTEEESEFRVTTSAGEVRHCSFTCQVTEADSEKTPTLLGIMRDITDQKMTEELKLERDAAEKANQTKSIFLANVSHELRTPMHGILSFARFGQQKIETASKEKLKTYFDEIYESASRLMTLLNDILDLSKLEAGKIVYSVAEENLGEIVNAVFDEMKAHIEEKGLTVKIEQSMPVIAELDASRIMQVIRNLLSNAIKFSSPGSCVQIKLDDHDQLVRCTVTNYGVGIPPSELESIFNKFVQSSKTRTGAGGTGLGLAICREIIAHHDGRIWAESALDKKTEFIFELPKTARPNLSTAA